MVAENGEEWDIKNAVRLNLSPRHTPTLLLLACRVWWVCGWGVHNAEMRVR